MWGSNQNPPSGSNRPRMLLPGCARLTQLLGLTLLAPDVQERVLALESVGGTEPLSERVLRPVARAPSWVEQRTLFESARG
jgi:hypothetical protein